MTKIAASALFASAPTPMIVAFQIVLAASSPRAALSMCSGA
jgi:hypothetical protein